MEKDIDDSVLLVGEADLSFAVSLLEQAYCHGRHVTATCYESRDEAMRRYGGERVSANLAALERLGCHRVLFGVDACQLATHFNGGDSDNDRFQRIIFMFPHVSGRSNLRKNRALMDAFMRSARDVLKPLSRRPCVYVTLAAGQGGTRFEHEPSKRCANDTWRINQIAQHAGLILTECYPLCPQRFACYASTGFRSQAKSFRVENALVHKFEPSLPLATAADTLAWRCSQFLLDNERRMAGSSFVHPLVELKYRLVDELKASAPHRRVVIVNDDDDASVNGSTITCMSGLCMDETTTRSECVNNLKYEIRFHCTAPCVDALRRDLIALVERVLSSSSPPSRRRVVTDDDDDEKAHLLFVDCDDATESGGHLVAAIRQTTNRQSEPAGAATTITTSLTCAIDATRLLQTLYGLEDERLVYTDDMRAYECNDDDDAAKKRWTTWRIRPVCVEPLKWQHDLSFWHNDNDNDNDEPFTRARLLAHVRNTCSLELVRSLELIETYVNESGRRASCYRLVYESCDRALAWSHTTRVQLLLRQRLANESTSSITLR